MQCFFCSGVTAEEIQWDNLRTKSMRDQKLSDFYSWKSFTDFQAMLSMRAVTSHTSQKQLLAWQRNSPGLSTLQNLTVTLPAFLPQLQTISYITEFAQFYNSGKNELDWVACAGGSYPSIAPSPDAQGTALPLLLRSSWAAEGRIWMFPLVRKTYKWWLEF